MIRSYFRNISQPNMDSGELLHLLHSPLCPPMQVEGGQLKLHVAGIFPLRCSACGDMITDMEGV